MPVWPLAATIAHPSRSFRAIKSGPRRVGFLRLGGREGGSPPFIGNDMSIPTMKMKAATRKDKFGRAMIT